MTTNTMNVLQMPNVCLYEDAAGKGVSTVTFTTNKLREVLIKFAIEKPLWKFVLRGPVNSTTLACRGATVHCEGEELGVITTEYLRSDYCISIQSHRVETSRGKQRTADVKKALSICRKAFVPRNTAERIEDAKDKASGALNHAKYEFYQAKQNAKRELSERVFAFALEQNEQVFIEYLRKAEPKAVSLVAKYKEASINHLTVDKVQDQISAGNTALVVLDSGKYIVRQHNDVHMYDDATLPERLRGKLGMLKLVEEGQVISDIGCRATTEVFVIVLDDEASV